MSQHTPIYPQETLKQVLERIGKQANAYRPFVVAPQVVGGDTSLGAELRSVGQGGSLIYVKAGDPIQKAIDAINAEGGGGTIFAEAGTHTISTALTGYSGIRFKGQSESTTIFDFNDTSANLTLTGTNVYTTGTITSITGGVNVTGSGTAWLANAAAGRHFFLKNRWYKIAAVTGDTTLVLAEGYAGNATLPGASYRIASAIKDVDFEDITFEDSTGTSLVFTDVRNITFKNCTLQSSNVGLAITNGSEIGSDNLIVVAHGSDGIQLTRVGFCDFESTPSAGNGGNGWTLSDCETIPIMVCGASSNTGDGMNLTDCSQILLTMDIEANGGQGIEFVSGNSFITVRDGYMRGNTSDGIKITGTGDNCIVQGVRITGNGGYGINNAASTNDNNQFLDNIYDSNTTSNILDSGMGTVIR